MSASSLHLVGRVVNRLYHRLSELCTSAFGLIAALAWNEAMQGLLNKTDLPADNKVYYALSVTLIAVVVAYLLEVLGGWLRVDDRPRPTPSGGVGAPFRFRVLDHAEALRVNREQHER